MQMEESETFLELVRVEPANPETTVAGEPLPKVRRSYFRRMVYGDDRNDHLGRSAERCEIIWTGYGK